MKINKYKATSLKVCGIVFVLFFQNSLPREDVILNIQSLLSNDLVYGTYSPFRNDLYSRKRALLPIKLSSGQWDAEEMSDIVNSAEEVEILKEVMYGFEEKDTLIKFKGVLEKDLRSTIPPMNLYLFSNSNDNPAANFLSKTTQKDTTIVIPPTTQGDYQCGFHAVMNMLIIQQYLIGNLSDAYRLKNIFSSVTRDILNPLKTPLLYDNSWLKLWGFGAMGMFLEFLIANLQTYEDLKKYVTELPNNLRPKDSKYNMLKREVLALWGKNKKKKRPFYYFKIYYGRHDKKHKKYFRQYPSARNFGSLYLHEKKEGRSIRLGRDVKAIKYILDESRKKQKIIAIPIIVREQGHNYALVIAQNKEGKRVYVLTDSLYLESNRDTSFVKDLAEELRQ
jgi:hypothetical protein